MHGFEIVIPGDLAAAITGISDLSMQYPISTCAVWTFVGCLRTTLAIDGGWEMIHVTFSAPYVPLVFCQLPVDMIAAL